MNNTELKNNYENLLVKIEQMKQTNLDVSELMEQQLEILQTGYNRLVEELNDKKYSKNPKKYSTLLSYLHTMKKILTQLNRPTDKIEEEENNLKQEMQQNELSWLLTSL